MLAGVEGVQFKITGPTGTIRKCALTEEHQKSWQALETEIKSLHGINGPVSVNYLDEDGDQILIDSDAELVTLLKWVQQTKASVVRMTVTPAYPAMPADPYNSTNSMASFRTQDSFSGVIPAPDGAAADSWRASHSHSHSLSHSHGQRPLSQAAEYASQGSVDYGAPPADRPRADSDAAAAASKINSVAREAAYKAAVEANNAARRAFEESKLAARATREQAKAARRGAAGDSLPAYE